MCHCNFDKNYILKLQQNYGIILILSKIVWF